MIQKDEVPWVGGFTRGLRGWPRLDGSSVLVTAREPLPALGVLVGDWLLIEKREPRYGEIILLNKKMACVRSPVMEIRRFSPQRLDDGLGPMILRGVVVGLYRKYGIEESAHGPS